MIPKMTFNNKNETSKIGQRSGAEKSAKLAANGDLSEPKLEYDYFPGKIDPYVIVILSQL